MSPDQMANEVFIVSAQRTPIGAFQGLLGSVSAPALAGTAARAALASAQVEPAAMDEVLLGCVLPAGLGQAPARQAAVAAGVPSAVPCTTISKVCGSGMKAVMIGVDAIRAGSSQAVLAGGMESMTNAPYLLPKARSGYRMGHAEMFDHMFLDGLQNAGDGRLMGAFAEATATHFGFTRDAQDAYVRETILRARSAGTSGAFQPELATVRVPARKGDYTVAEDEIPPTCDPEKLARLKAAFEKNGTVTAGSSSSLADGAAVLILTGPSGLSRFARAPIARIVAQATHAHDAEWFTTAPAGAVRKVLTLAGWSIDSVDLFEINEAFAVVTMAAIHDLALDPTRVNVNGGACALGHPIGASGARILVTLVHALRARRLRRGIATLCIGGGEATAMAVEVLP